MTPPERREILLAFYRKVRPNPAWWGSIAREASDVVAVRDGWRNLLDWAAGCVMVYMTLFGVGHLIFGETALGLKQLAIAVAAGMLLYTDLTRRGWKTVIE